MLRPDGRGQHGRPDLVETTANLKNPQLAFPGEIAGRQRPAAGKLDAGSLGPWIEETLASWNLA
jgi:hypothetical protein